MTDSCDNILFRLKTDNAYGFKTMTEVVSNVIKTSFWKINQDGITMSMFDQSRKTMISLDLNGSDFSVYEFFGTEDMNIGINSVHFHKMLKSIKKKDNLEYFRQ